VIGQNLSQAHIWNEPSGSEHTLFVAQLGLFIGSNVSNSQESFYYHYCYYYQPPPHHIISSLLLLLLLSEIVHKAQHTTRVTTNKKHAMLCIKKRRLTLHYSPTRSDLYVPQTNGQLRTRSLHNRRLDSWSTWLWANSCSAVLPAAAAVESGQQWYWPWQSVQSAAFVCRWRHASGAKVRCRTIESVSHASRCDRIAHSTSERVFDVSIVNDRVINCQSRLQFDMHLFECCSMRLTRVASFSGFFLRRSSLLAYRVQYLTTGATLRYDTRRIPAKYLQYYCNLNWFSNLTRRRRNTVKSLFSGPRVAK